MKKSYHKNYHGKNIIFPEKKNTTTLNYGAIEIKTKNLIVLIT